MIEVLKAMQHDVLADESGQDLVEYALVAGFIGLGSVAVVKGMANVVINGFNGITTTLAGNI